MTERIIVKSVETREGITFKFLEEGKFKYATIPFHNYFFIKTKEYEIFKEDFHSKFTFCIEKCEKVGQFTRIYLSNNFMRYKVREWWEERTNTFEADVKANKRYLLERPKLQLHNEKIPYLFYDIETDDRLPLQKDEKGDVIAKSRILSFSAVDNNGKVYFVALEKETDEEEIIFLNRILKIFSNYGVISGWNSERFDMPWIKQRCDKLGVSYASLDYNNHIDYLLLYKKYTRKSLGSYSLNSVSNAELNQSKIDQAKGNGAVYNTWKNNLDQLRIYNVEDSNLIYKINKNVMFIEVSMHRANNSGCHVRNTMNNSDSGDFLLMRQSLKDGVIQPSKPTKEQVFERIKQGKISGGFTRALEKGFFKEVDVWDYKSFYPCTISTYNISPETYIDNIKDKTLIPQLIKDGYIVTPSNYNEEQKRQSPHRVYKKKKGIIPKVCEKLITERDKIKYSMKEFEESDPIKYREMYLHQYALKTDGNSIYGILSFPYSRWYKWEVGDTVTTCCQATIKESYKCLEQWGCKVIGGDTDSTFVILGDKTWEDIDQKFIEFWNNWHLQWGVGETHKIIFEHEKTVKNMLFCKKKNYAYVDNGHLVIKGLECIKADSNPYAAKLQKRFIEEICFDKYNAEYWENKIEEIHSKVFDQELTVKQLTMNKALTKMPQEYIGVVMDKKTGAAKIKADGTIQRKAISAHVKLAERLINAGVDIYPGSKIHFVVILNKPILAITPEEFTKGSGIFKHRTKKKEVYEHEFNGEYDAKYYWLRVMKPLVKVIYTYYGELPNWTFRLTATEIKKIIGD